MEPGVTTQRPVNVGKTDAYGTASASVTPQLDQQMAPLGNLALDALRVQTGARVIDVGCGAGQTCEQLADLVGPLGYVLGVDISPRLVSYSKKRTQALTNVDIELGDIQSYSFKPAAFDHIYSRFGVMAFVSPHVAFRNLRTALKPEGRLSFVCWRDFSENEIDRLPLHAALDFLPTELASNIHETAPFSFANPDIVRGVLEETGYRSIEISSHDKSVSAGGVDLTLELCLKVGMLGRIIRQQPHLRAILEAPVRRALHSINVADDVQMNAAVWVVTAKK